MTASVQRAMLAAIGRDLIDARGGAVNRRVAGLAGTASAAPPSRFEGLSAVPDWLRWETARRGALARAVALVALAPVLATSIDGEWLGSVERVVGEDALDWAIAIGADRPAADDGLPVVAADRLEETGLTILRATLPEVLRGYLGAESAEPALAIDTASLAAAVRFVEERSA